MAPAIAARNIKLHDLKVKFGLQQLEDEQFFSEWLHDLPELTLLEQQALDRVKRNYCYLLDYPVMESIVKMVVLSPLLDLAGFYEPPFRVDGEVNIRVTAEDEGEVIQGNIDVLVIPQCGLSDVFSLLNRGNNLYSVLQIFKRFGALISSFIP
jgi:hypothetical protein